MYVQRKGEKGWLFHVFNQKMGNSSTSSITPKNIDYDFTFLESTDSVNMLSTIVVPVGTTPTSLSLLSCGYEREFSPETIYVKPMGKNSLEYRFKISFPFKFWDEVYQCTEPFNLKYNIKIGGRYSTLSFGYSRTKWKSNREKMLAIIQVIKYNTGKL